jgi:hypothetical protein
MTRIRSPKWIEVNDPVQSESTDMRTAKKTRDALQVFQISKHMRP